MCFVGRKELQTKQKKNVLTKLEFNLIFRGFKNCKVLKSVRIPTMKMKDSLYVKVIILSLCERRSRHILNNCLSTCFFCAWFVLILPFLLVLLQHLALTHNTFYKKPPRNWHCWTFQKLIRWLIVVVA